MLRDRDDILAVTGESPTAYGRDVGRNEGRRNHVDSRQYKAEDGSSRTRIRYIYVCRYIYTNQLIHVNTYFHVHRYVSKC